jgi:hypothetical protein
VEREEHEKLPPGDTTNMQAAIDCDGENLQAVSRNSAQRNLMQHIVNLQAPALAHPSANLSSEPMQQAEANQTVQRFETEQCQFLRTPPGTPPLSAHSSPRTSIARLMARLKQGFSGNGSAKGGGPKSGSHELVPECETLRRNNYHA